MLQKLSTLIGQLATVHICDWLTKVKRIYEPGMAQRPKHFSAGAEPKDEPGPPGYEDVVGQQPQEVQQPQQVQPVQRKKSLTNHHV